MSRKPSRRTIIMTLVLAGLTALVVWIARNTYWENVPVPLPLRGEALLNPHYAAQRFAESLGASTDRRHVLGDMPSPEDVMVLGSWHWNLVAARREKLERWVEAGGRLVVDRSLIGTGEAFERWSGIESVMTGTEDEGSEPEASRKKPRKADDEGCYELEPESYRVCSFDDGLRLIVKGRLDWSLHDEIGTQVARVRIGRGSVTMVNAWPFVYRAFLQGDHARLFIAATQLQRGDRVHFLSEQNHPNLLALLWMYGAPALCLGLLWVALALWRNGVRFGPPEAQPEAARRSLAEQIRGTGQFVMRFGSGAALHAAQVRALDEAARRRISAYAALSAAERSERIAKLAGVDAGELSAAIHFSGRLRSPEFRSAIGLLEAARRKVFADKKGLWHGNGSEHDHARS